MSAEALPKLAIHNNRDRVDFSNRARVARALEISRTHPCAGLAPCGWDCACWRDAALAKEESE